ncbi:MAG: alanine racemase [Nitrospinae bacterium]|nr:alanine racemase [Nitrospinota bacterium]
MRSDVTWADIHLDRLHANLDLIAETARVPLMPVVKANAYGHGAVPLALELQRRKDVAALCLWTVDEAIELRKAGVKRRLILFGGVPQGRAKEAHALGVEPVVGDIDRLPELARAATAKCPFPLHVKFDTGMNRLGAPPARAEALYRAVAANPKLRPVGLMTHFVDAEKKRGVVTRQITLFDDLCRSLTGAGFALPPRHAANSAAACLHPGARYEAVRPGIGMYGYQTFAGAPIGLRPVMEWRAKLQFVRTVAKGASVSYGPRWRATGPTTVAALAAGYADGYSRRLSGKGFAIMGNVAAPQIGTVCMDVTLFDVTGVDAPRTGTVATLMGDGVGADRLAALAGTIPYEILCGVGRRVPRHYLKNGTCVRTLRMI